MRRILATLTFITAIQFAQSPALAQGLFGGAPPEITLEGETSVLLDMTLEHPVILAKINGQGPFPFIVDTGAPLNLLMDEGLVEELGIEKFKAGRIGGPGNPNGLQAYRSDLDSITIGDARFENITAISWDRDPIYHGSGAPRGIIGLRLFSELLVTFDYPASKLLISDTTLPEPDGKTVFEYHSNGPAPEVTIDIAGMPTKAHLDTGSSASIMIPEDLASKLALIGEPSVVGVARAAASEFELQRIKLDGSVTIGSHTFNQPEALMHDLYPWVNVGSRVLKDFTLSIDARNKRLALVPREGLSDQLLIRGMRYALRLDAGDKPGTLLAKPTLPFGPAGKAGIKDGDLVVAINGSLVDEVSAQAQAIALRTSPLVLTIDRDGELNEVMLTMD